jgi:hypothetical protein
VCPGHFRPDRSPFSTNTRPRALVMSTDHGSESPPFVLPAVPLYLAWLARSRSRSALTRPSSPVASSPL